jgi:hypothetical protein
MSKEQPADFDGFTVADFGLGSDREAAREKLAAFVAMICGELSHDEVSRAGALTAVFADDERRPTSDGAYLEIAVGPSGLQLALRAVTDSSGEAFSAWLDERSSLERLEDLTGFNIILLERRALNYEERYRTKRPKWTGGGEVRVRTQIPASNIDPSSRDELLLESEAMDGRWERIAWALEKRWEVDLASRLGGDLARDFVAEVRRLLPIVGRLNLASRQAKATKAPALDRAPWRASG